MGSWIPNLIDWTRSHPLITSSLLVVSVLTFIGTLVIVPWILVRLPENYFLQRRRHRLAFADRHPVIRLLLLVAKNVLAIVLIAAGITMLVLPGQGILTIVVGIVLLDFPGKYALERWLITRRPVLRSINWLRKRAEKPPLVVQ